ncbi:MAG: hypothetical protein EBR82_75510 [Caulobacteraceae bacterium]|nr:hypothetical protein [Caulobacteraceae bacterium]
MNQTEIDEAVNLIAELDEKRTQEDWQLYELVKGAYEVCVKENYAFGGVCVPHRLSDAAFIAAAPLMARTVAAQAEKIKRLEAYKAFFDWFWGKYTEQALCLDDAADALDTLLTLGLVVSEPYNPAIHGESGAQEWGCELGDPWYSKNAAMKE